MIGVGLTPEGIEQNDVIYEMMMETIWNTDSVDLDDWVVKYEQRRYGVESQELGEAWKLLRVRSRH